MRSIIHVNQHFIKANARDGGNRPVYTIKQGGKTIYARGLEIEGPSRFVYRATKPLSCGARCWLETEAPLRLTDQMTHQEAKDAA